MINEGSVIYSNFFDIKQYCRDLRHFNNILFYHESIVRDDRPSQQTDVVRQDFF